MKVELQINNSTNANARFFGWSPSPCRIRITDPTGATTQTVVVQLSGVSTATGGAVVFRKTAAGANATTLDLSLPINGASVPFFVVGRKASISNGDVSIQARAKIANSPIVGLLRLMVRIRKNAESLTTAERNRFLAAFAQLNTTGRFQDFRDMHTFASQPQAHGAKGFLPWHRAYLLQHAHQIVKEILFHNLAPLIPTGNGAKIYMETLIRGLDHRSIWQSHRTLHGSSEIRNRAGPITLAHHDFVRIVDEVLVREHLEKRNRLLFMGIYAVGGRLVRPAHDAILRVILAK